MRPLRDLVIYCDRASNAASLLATRLNGRRVVSNPSRRLRRTDGSLCINYGSSHGPAWGLGPKSILLNNPEAVKAAISKVYSYGKFREAGIPTLEYTTSREQAEQWFSSGNRVLARRDGLSSGKGISIIEKGESCSGEYDFYSLYFKKTHEYRVHVFRSRIIDGLSGGASLPNSVGGAPVQSYRVIDITQKKRVVELNGNQSDDAAERNNRTVYQRVVRSLDNGWVHAHEGVHLPDGFRDALCDAAIKSVSALGLDFGAVDIIAQFGTKDSSKLYGMAVLEVNTAPGLGNEQTINAYVSAIQELYGATSADRVVPRVVRKKRVKKLVMVQITTAKGAKVMRERERWVLE